MTWYFLASEFILLNQLFMCIAVSLDLEKSKLFRGELVRRSEYNKIIKLPTTVFCEARTLIASQKTSVRTFQKGRLTLITTIALHYKAGGPASIPPVERRLDRDE